MSAIDKAARVIERHLPAMPDQQSARISTNAVRALDAAGLLVSPERDAEVAARAWDEGHAAGVRNASAEFDGPVQDNPYRAGGE